MNRTPTAVELYLERSAQAEVDEFNFRVVRWGFEADILQLDIPVLSFRG